MMYTCVFKCKRAIQKYVSFPYSCAPLPHRQDRMLMLWMMYTYVFTCKRAIQNTTLFHISALMLWMYVMYTVDVMDDVHIRMYVMYTYGCLYGCHIHPYVYITYIRMYGCCVMYNMSPSLRFWRHVMDHIHPYVYITYIGSRRLCSVLYYVVLCCVVLCCSVCECVSLISTVCRYQHHTAPYKKETQM